MDVEITPSGTSDGIAQEPGSPEWISQRLDKMEAEAPKAPEAEPAEEPTAPPAKAEAAAAQPEPAPEAKAPSWRDTVIPEDDEEVNEQYAFFKGKPVGEVFKSFKHLTGKLQEQGRKISQLEAKTAAVETLKELGIRPPEPAPAKRVDPKDEIDWENDPILQPKKVYEAMERSVLERAERAAEEKLSKAEGERQARERDRETERATIQAFERARVEVKASEDDFATIDPDGVPRIDKVLYALHRRPDVYGANAQFNPKAIAHVYSSLYPAAAAAPESKAPPPQPAPANPPGAKRAGAAEPPTKAGSSIPYEQRREIEQVYRAAGFEGEALERLVQKAGAKLKGQAL